MILDYICHSMLLWILPYKMPLFLSLLFLLLGAKLLGEIFERMGQPSMIGEVLGGVILGPSILGILQVSEELKVLSELAVFLLVIHAGLEIKVQDVVASMSGKKIWISLLGFFLPILLGVLLGVYFNLKIMVIIFLALCISITALPVSVRILMDIGILNTDVGKRIISAAIFNDVAALIVLGVILDMHKVDNMKFSEIAYLSAISIAKVLIFFIFIFFTQRLLTNITKRIEFYQEKVKPILDKVRTKNFVLAALFVFILGFASIAEIAGLHNIVGAFFAAMLLDKTLIGKENFHHLDNMTGSLTNAFLGPIFFATIGLYFDIGVLKNVNLLLAVMFIAFVSKILGGYLGAMLAGMGHKQSLAIGFGLNARGIMELVIANIALQQGIIDVSIFSILVLMGIVTTVASPILLKRSAAFIIAQNNTTSK